MNPSARLKDPTVEPSDALRALLELLGPQCAAYEPETIWFELARRGILDPGNHAGDALKAKLMGALTVVSSNAWTTDHDAFFAFALACDGVPASAEALHHPTVCQLAWAIHEIAAIRGMRVTDDEGFDPDTVDPAIAAVAYDEGFVVLPTELSFADDALARLYDAEGLALRVRTKWEALSKLTPAQLRAELAGQPEDVTEAQLRRLADVALYIQGRIARKTVGSVSP